MKTSMVKEIRQFTPSKWEMINIFPSASNRTIFKTMLPITLITSDRCGSKRHSLKEKKGNYCPNKPDLLEGYITWELSLQAATRRENAISLQKPLEQRFKCSNNQNQVLNALKLTYTSSYPIYYTPTISEVILDEMITSLNALQLLWWWK